MADIERNGIARKRRKHMRRTINETPNKVDIFQLNKLLRSVYGSPAEARKRFQIMAEQDRTSSSN